MSPSWCCQNGYNRLSCRQKERQLDCSKDAQAAPHALTLKEKGLLLSHFKHAHVSITWDERISSGPQIGASAKRMDALPATDRGAIFCPLSLFRDISRSYKRIITKLSIPAKLSSWHILTKGKLVNSYMSTTNDVTVTSCFPVPVPVPIPMDIS